MQRPPSDILTLFEALDLIVERRGCTMSEACSLFLHAARTGQIVTSDCPVGGPPRVVDRIEFRYVDFMWRDIRSIACKHEKPQERPRLHRIDVPGDEWRHAVAWPVFNRLLIERAGFDKAFPPQSASATPETPEPLPLPPDAEQPKKVRRRTKKFPEKQIRVAVAVKRHQLDLSWSAQRLINRLKTLESSLESPSRSTIDRVKENFEQLIEQAKASGIAEI
jgi:hypothetical protein